MVRYITNLAQIPDAEITLKPRRGNASGQRIKKDGGELLLEVSGFSHGFRYEETQKGNPKYTLPLNVSEEFADALYKVTEKLGSVDYSPVYETEDGGFLVYARVLINSEDLDFSYIHDVNRDIVRPVDKTDTPMDVTAIIKVDSLQVGGNNPKIMLFIVQAEVKDFIE